MSTHRYCRPPGRGPGRRAARALAGLAAVGLALACGAGAAQADTGLGSTAAVRTAAAPGSGLQVAVSGSEAAPKLTLTNGSSAPCQVPAAALGAVVFDQVQQGGKAVEPVAGTAWFDDPVPQYLTTTLRTLAPGQSLQVPLPVVSPGPTGPALESAAWVDADTSTGALYPLKAGQPVQVTLSYAPPLVSSGSVRLCQAAGASAPATLTASASFGSAAAAASSPRKVAGIPLTTLIYAAAGVLVLLLIAVFVFFRSRRRRNPAATKAVVILALLAAGLAHSTVSAPPASAKVTVTTPVINTVYGRCMKVLQSPGGDPSDILGSVLGPNSNVEVQDSGGDQNHEIHLPGGKIIIYWDPLDNHEYAGGGNADPCSTLYHEMDHAYQDLNGGQNQANCWTTKNGKPTDSGIPSNEVQATREQNMLRVNEGLPPRSTYGELPLPDGPCQPPPPSKPAGPPRACTGSGCGETNGDPHLTTFEGVHYDFQAAGEFVAADDPRGGYQIQVRQQPFPGRPTIAVNTAVAMDVADDRLQVEMSTQGFVLTLNGTAQSSTTMTLPHGGTVDTGYADGSETLTVTWPDASTAVISQIGVWGLHLTANPSAAHTGNLRGLLGNLGAAASTSVQTAAGATISSPSFSTLYPGFADSWRVTDASSLFTYAPGTSTATYTDKSFPHAAASLSSVPDLTAAKAQCTGAGITDPALLADCEFDVGLTGESAFARADAESQPAQATLPPTQNGGTFGIDGASATVTLPAAGSSTTLHFTGTAGQVVFVDVPSSTVPNTCGIIELKAPDGTNLGEGCVVNGSGSISAVKLPATGTYTVQIGPGESGPGNLTVRLIQDFDQSGAVTPDGPPVTATIGQPGAKAGFTFDEAPGTTVFVQVLSSTIPPQCGTPELFGPDGGQVGEGCTVTGSAYISATALKASGTYSVLVDPEAPDTGTVTFKVITDHDQVEPITVGGPPLTATIAQPGATSSFTFQGTAGQSVAVQVSGSTLPTDCGDLQLLDAQGTVVADECLLGATGSVKSTKLAKTGQYTILIDPSALSTGTAIVRLTAG
ncbi:MAG TPA: M91 family zinc metallopeptidase [Actinocrinis sp.]|nr:M91 family zinc metallopeptidase [Actinocrinis sp.]